MSWILGQIGAKRAELEGRVELLRKELTGAFARMKTYKILRDCRLRGDGVHHAMLGIARLHNLMLTA